MTKTALVTGASKGIGKAITIEFAKSGLNVVVGYNKSATAAMALAQDIADLGVRALPLQIDLKNTASIQEMFEYIFRVFPTLDVLVNNAGISLVKPLLDTSPEEWSELMEVNLSAAYHTTRLALPKMMDNGFGRIINISSIWGVTGASCEVAYSATKAGLIGFTKALARELPEYITANCITPGIIDTDMNSDLSKEELMDFLKSVPAGRMGKPEEIASLAGYLISKKAGYINGQIIGINGGIC